MSSSTVRLNRNAKVATDEDLSTHIHTLVLLQDTPANTDSHIVWGDGAKMATDETAGVHTLKVKAV